MRNRSLLTLSLLLLLCASGALAQTQPAAPQAPPPPPDPKPIQKTSVAVNLDGDLSDAAWQQATVIDRFYETSPGDNNEPKVKTVAYVTYDDRYFYIGVRADDPDPRRIRAPFVDRDGVIGTDDNIAIFLDTRNDKRSAIEIRVNPRGIQADGIFNDANFNEDFSPDFFYDTAAKITDAGWSAEFRVPFSSLRYDKADPQTWNILVWRNYPREYRYAFHSAPIPRGSNCLICHMHPLTGFTGLPDASNLVVAPYATAQQAAFPTGGLGSSLENDDLSSDAGLDVKWNPTANSALDITVNPDFSTIETDVPQITVNRRFSVFYPEKRPFFLEGFDLFDTPLNVAYTRNIADPSAGARSTGRFGDTAYTLLVTQDEGGGDLILPGPTGNDQFPTDFKSYATIGRVRHDLGKGFVGAVLTSREITDGGGHNRVFGPDFQWRPNDSDTLTGQFLLSDTQNPDLDLLDPSVRGKSSTSHALSVAWSHQKRKYDWFVSSRDIGEDFRADLGFVTQAGFRDVEAGGGLRFYPEGKLRYVRPSIVYNRQTDRENDTVYETVSVGVSGIGVKNTNFFIGYRPSEKILVRTPTSPEGELLDQGYADFFLQFDPYRRIPRVTLSATYGDQIDFAGGRIGDGLTLSIGTTVRPHDRLDLRFDASRQTLDVDGGRLFTAQFERLRLQYSFSAKSLVRVIGQYVSTDRNPALYGFPVSRQSGSFLGNVLYSYKLNWQTVLFVGYGDTRVLTLADELVETGRSLFFKVSYAYQR